MTGKAYEVWSKVPASKSFEEITGSRMVSRCEARTINYEEALDCLDGLEAVGLQAEIRTIEEERLA